MTRGENAVHKIRPRYGIRLALLLPIFLLFLHTTVLPTQTWAASLDADEPLQVVGPDESQAQTPQSDTTPPTITTNVDDADTLSGIFQVVLRVDDADLRNYSIQLLHADGSPVIADGANVGAFPESANGPELAYDWDTTNFANGDYLIELKATDQNDNLATDRVAVAVINAGSEPAYPPITPVLNPIPIAETIQLMPPRRSADQSPPNTDNSANDLLKNAKKDVLAARIHDAEMAARADDTTPQESCALFFGTCWYWSVPGTVIASGIAYVAYRSRIKVS